LLLRRFDPLQTGRRRRTRLDRREARVLEYRSLAGRPVWPARDRCDKPHFSQRSPDRCVRPVSRPSVSGPTLTPRRRRGRRQAQAERRPFQRTDAARLHLQRGGGRDLKNRRLEASISSRMKSERIAWRRPRENRRASAQHRASRVSVRSSY